MEKWYCSDTAKKFLSIKLFCGSSTGTATIILKLAVPVVFRIRNSKVYR